MTETEKILAKASGVESVRPGDIVDARVSRAMIHDNNMHLVIKQFQEIRNRRIWDPERVCLFVDHHSPSTSAAAAKNQQSMRRFARQYDIQNLFDCGEGISHVLMVDHGYADKGGVVIGTDSHTTGEGVLGAFAVGIGATDMAAALCSGKIWIKVPETIRVNIEGSMMPGVEVRDVANVILRELGPNGASYKAIEFSGSLMQHLSTHEKMVLCIMGAETGAKNCIVTDSAQENEMSYDIIANINASGIEPTVACPDLPTNVRNVSELADERIPVNQVAIASCAGGLLKDLEIAATLLNGRKVNPQVRLIVTPATRAVFSEAMKLGYLQIIHDAGGVVTSPGCSACGAHDVGALAEGEVCVSTTTRNMPGRMGKGGIVYLAGAGVATASAISGYISCPEIAG